MTFACRNALSRALFINTLRFLHIYLLKNNPNKTDHYREVLSCKGCGQRFATEDALRKRKNWGKGERESQNKSLCHEIDWTSEEQETGEAQT